MKLRWKSGGRNIRISTALRTVWLKGKEFWRPLSGCGMGSGPESSLLWFIGILGQSAKWLITWLPSSKRRNYEPFQSAGKLTPTMSDLPSSFATVRRLKHAKPYKNHAKVNHKEAELQMNKSQSEHANFQQFEKSKSKHIWGPSIPALHITGWGT